MNKFNGFMENKFVPVATKISSNKYLRAISIGSMSLMAIIIVGAIFSLLGNIAFQPYQNFITYTGLKYLFSFAPKVTTDLLAVYMVFSVGYNGAKIFGSEESAFNSGLISLVSYMLLVPQTEVMQKGAFQPDVLINMQWLGARGIFLALFTGIIATQIYCFIVNKKITIKMPDGVPEQVSKSFTALIPAFLILIIFSLIRVGFSLTSYESANNFIYTILQTPLQHLTGSLPAFILIVLISQLLWFFGVHGSYTVLPIFLPIWLGYIGENSAAYAAGKAMPHVFNIGLFDITTLGGCGATLGLVIVMFFFAKSERYKAFSKMVLPCGIFNVNEPVIFGMPLMLNPVIFIPFLLIPVAILLMAYAAIKLNLMPAPIGMMIPASTPPIFSGLMQGSWRISVFQVFAVLFSAVVYYPFFKALDKQALKEENEAASK
jgi:PTS system cellobiose-specific IIC component